MKYKTDQIKQDWINPNPPSERNEAHRMLREFVYLIDRLSVILGFGEVTMTCFLREKVVDNPTYHTVFQAVDLRTKDKPLVWKWAIYAIGVIIEKLNWKFQIYPHFESWGKPDEHFHIAIREGEKE